MVVAVSVRASSRVKLVAASRSHTDTATIVEPMEKKVLVSVPRMAQPTSTMNPSLAHPMS